MITYLRYSLICLDSGVTLSWDFCFYRALNDRNGSYKFLEFLGEDRVLLSLTVHLNSFHGKNLTLWNYFPLITKTSGGDDLGFLGNVENLKQVL